VEADGQRQEPDERGGHEDRGGGAVLGRPDRGMLLRMQAIGQVFERRMRPSYN